MTALIISLSFSFLAASLLVLQSYKLLQIYQLSSQRTSGVFDWLKRTKFEYLLRYFSLAFFQFLCMFIFIMAFNTSWARFLGFLLYITLGIFFVVVERKKKQKTPLVLTKRVIRQIVMLFLLFFGFCFVSVYFTINQFISYGLISIVSAIIPLVVMLSHTLLLPFEILVGKYYKAKAKRRLQNGIVVVGITGSYGKTSSKNILAAMLSKKYNVAVSPASYNTPMGLTKFINSGLFGKEILIAEMGARHRGDISELCQLLQPDYGIITITGNQHLATFGTSSEIVQTKIELAEGVKKFTIVNSDDERLMTALAEKNSKRANKLQLLYSGKGGADVVYSEVELSCEGTSFKLRIGENEATISTPLLGRHIPELFAQCSLLAFKLGITLQEISAAAKELLPTPHRLQLIKTPFGAVIDDAYNSNPRGARNALEVLSLFEGERVVITPGFVELGRVEQEENFLLGKEIGKIGAVLISVNNQKIVEGAKEGGSEETRAILAKDLEEAVKIFQDNFLQNATVLFLNDLPDNYK
jgi:UDP-N-acetylmuramoyl-tripeptide--D-alanyl-D-alanine ligase